MSSQKSDLDERATTLKALAEKVLGVLRRQARRAFVVELAGTPKAGKSTSVKLVAQFLKDCGYRVHVLEERASVCPLPMKGHFFFNTWTTCSMIAEVLATVDTDVDVVILDRGFFDALVWLQRQEKAGLITSKEHEAFEAFVLLERWRRLVDVTFVARVSPEIAMGRENQGRLLPRKGSIMNADALSDFNQTLANVERRYGQHFTLAQTPPSENDPRRDNLELVASLLHHVQKWADRRIIGVPREQAESLFATAQGDPRVLTDPWHDALGALAAAAVVNERSNLENNKSAVQLVACGFPVHEGKVFLISRSDKDEKAQEYGRYTLWKGCHLPYRHHDSLPQERLYDLDASTLHSLATEALVDRLREDFHLAIELRPRYVGMVWRPKEHHMALLF